MSDIHRLKVKNELLIDSGKELINILQMVADQNEMLEDFNAPTSVLNRLTPSKALRQKISELRRVYYE